MGAIQSLIQRPKTNDKYGESIQFHTKSEGVSPHAKYEDVILEDSYRMKKQKRKGKKGTTPLPSAPEDQNDQETDHDYEWVAYNNLSTLPGGQHVQDEQPDRMKEIWNELDNCVKTLTSFQAEIRGSGLPRRQTQARHAEDYSGEELYTDENEEDTYAYIVGQSTFYVNAEEYQELKSGDDEESGEEMEAAEDVSTTDQTSLRRYTTPVVDVTLHDTSISGTQSPSLTGVAEEAQDESGEYACPEANPLGRYNQIPSGDKVINNRTKNVPAIDNQIQAITEPSTSLPKYDGSLYEQPYAGTGDSVEYSRLNTEPQTVCYETAVIDGLCKVQLAPDKLVLVPFDSVTVGEFCNMMIEDYDGSCCFIYKDNCSCSKRIQLERLKAPFLIQFGEIHNHVLRVE